MCDFISTPPVFFIVFPSIVLLLISLPLFSTLPPACSPQPLCARHNLILTEDIFNSRLHRASNGSGGVAGGGRVRKRRVQTEGREGEREGGKGVCVGGEADRPKDRERERERERDNEIEKNIRERETGGFVFLAGCYTDTDRHYLTQLLQRGEGDSVCVCVCVCVGGGVSVCVQPGVYLFIIS